MPVRTALCAFLLLVLSTAWAEEPVQLYYNSQTDFVDMQLWLKNEHNANPSYIEMHVVLSPEAKARTEALSAQAIDKSLTLYLNGRAVSTSRVRSVLDTGQFRIAIPREMLLEMMPSLMQ